MQTAIKPTEINSTTVKAKKPGKFWLVVAVVFFILLLVDPIKFIPVVGEADMAVEGGISLSALLIYAVRSWLFHNIKEQFISKQ